MHYIHTDPCTIHAHTQHGKEEKHKIAQMDTHGHSLEPRQAQVQCVQLQLVHTGAPSRRWNKGTRVDTQITRLHPHRVTKATEMGPWGGSGILVSRGAERPRNTWTTFQRLISVEYFYPWHSNVTQPPGGSSVAITKADRVAGFESRLGGVPAWPVQGPGSHLIEYQTAAAEKQLTGHGERS